MCTTRAPDEGKIHIYPRRRTRLRSRPLGQEFEEHRPDVLCLRRAPAGLHDVTHHLVDDLEVAATNHLRHFGQGRDSFPTPCLQ